MLIFHYPQSLTPEDNLSALVEASTQQLCSTLHDVAKQCAKEETSMDNIVDQEMAVRVQTQGNVLTFSTQMTRKCLM